MYYLVCKYSFLLQDSLSSRKVRPSASSTLYSPLDVIFGSLALVRVSRALASHGGRLDVSEVAQRTRLSLPSVRAALRRLIQLDLVAAIGAGRTMVCSMRMEHPLSHGITSLFDAERAQADTLLRAMRETAQQIIPAPVAVWVYGSAARGTDTPDSDTDVAFVSSASAPTIDAEIFRERLTQITPERASRISVISFNPEELRKIAKEGTRFWRELERDAVVVFGDAPASFKPRLKGKPRS